MEAHAKLVPPALVRLCMYEDFTTRIRAIFGGVRVIGHVGVPVAFHGLQDDELDHFFVSPQARGTGVAALVLADAESRLAASGTVVAWLAFAIGNDRAARFYAKHGWHRAGTFIDWQASPAGPVPVEFWRYEQTLSQA